MIEPQVYKDAVVDFIHKSALRPLEAAVRKLIAQTTPHTTLGFDHGDLPFALVPERVYWPKIIASNGGIEFDTLEVCPCGPGRGSSNYGFTPTLAREIAGFCGYAPDRIVEAAGRIHQAEQWCLLAIERRTEAAESILVSQMTSLEMIEKELGIELWKGPRGVKDSGKKERRVLQI